jgi:hypothetical protein
MPGRKPSPNETRLAVGLLNDPQDAAANAHPGPIMRLLTGLEFAPIFSVSSGFRANPIVGLDSNREHIYPFAARPQGYSRNSLFTTQNINFDLRVLKMIPLGSGHLDVVAESFNLLNHSNISLLNTSFGSGGPTRCRLRPAYRRIESPTHSVFP